MKLIDTRSAVQPGMLAIVLAVLFSACSDPVTLTMEELAGTYEATTFTGSEGGVTVDLLAEGGALTITLTSDGSTTGTMTIPASLSESGEEEVESMAGSWTLAGQTVLFGQESDTVIRDVPFEIIPGGLEAEGTFGDTSVHIVLTRG